MLLKLTTLAGGSVMVNTAAIAAAEPTKTGCDIYLMGTDSPVTVRETLDDIIRHEEAYWHRRVTTFYDAHGDPD